MCETARNLLDTVDPDTNHFTDNTVNFSTYDMNDFYKSKVGKTNSLNIFHNNARSILSDSRLDDYNTLLDYINNPFHILAFTETWLKSDNKDLVIFKGYKECHLIRPIDEHFDFKESGGGYLFL